MNAPRPTHNVVLYFTSDDYVAPAQDEVFGITDLMAKILGMEVHHIIPSISLANARATLPLIVPPGKMNNLVTLLDKLAQKLITEGKLIRYEINTATT